MKGYILTVKSKYIVALVHYFTQLWKVTICCEQSFWTLWAFRIRFANTNCFIFSKLMLILHFICCRIAIVVDVRVVPLLVTVPLRLETRREETPATSSSCPAPKKTSKSSTEKKSTKIEVPTSFKLPLFGLEDVTSTNVTSNYNNLSHKNSSNIVIN